MLPRIGSPACHLMRAGDDMDAALAVALAKLFMHSYPVLIREKLSHPGLAGAEQWQSAMTYKIGGAFKGITNPQPHVMKALRLGTALGLLIDIVRKLIKRIPGYQQALERSRSARAGDFVLDAPLLPSPYASSFGGFVELPTVLWWTAGGVGASVFDLVQAKLASRRPQNANGQLPSDMSTMSLVGGGLIAGDSLAALSVGLYGLLKTVL